MYTITQICNELGIDPKRCRKELRNRGFHKNGTRWRITKGSRMFKVLLTLEK